MKTQITVLDYLASEDKSVELVVPILPYNLVPSLPLEVAMVVGYPAAVQVGTEPEASVRVS